MDTEWKVSLSPYGSGVHASLTHKKIALHLAHNLASVLEERDDAKIQWAPAYLEKLQEQQQDRISPLGEPRRRTAKQERADANREWNNKVPILAAELVACSTPALQNWGRQVAGVSLRAPLQRGRGIIDIAKYKDAFAETLRWAENLAAVS